eukprot:361801-Chlamydomonas_euryale.AAC.7
MPRPVRDHAFRGRQSQRRELGVMGADQICLCRAKQVQPKFPLNPRPTTERLCNLQPRPATSAR